MQTFRKIKKLTPKSLNDSISQEKLQTLENRLMLNHMKITHIGKIINFPELSKITHLYLSYNRIEKLDGIEFFTNLEHLGLSFNRILEFSELEKISFPEKIQGISLRGNFIELNPDYKAILIRKFKNIKIIDDEKIQENSQEYIEISYKIEQIFMDFIWKLEKCANRLEIIFKALQGAIELNKIYEIDITNYIKIIDKYSKIEEIPNFLLIPNPSIKILAKLIDFCENIGNSDDFLLENEVKITEKSRRELFEKIKQKFIKNKDFSLETYINSKILLKYEILFNEIISKISTNFIKLKSRNEKIIFAAQNLIQINENLEAFYIENSAKISEEQLNFFNEMSTAQNGFPIYSLNENYLKIIIEIIFNNYLKPIYENYRNNYEIITKYWPENIQLFSCFDLNSPSKNNDQKLIKNQIFLETTNFSPKAKIFPSLYLLRKKAIEKAKQNQEKREQTWSKISEKTIRKGILDSFREIKSFRKIELEKMQKDKQNLALGKLIKIRHKILLRKYYDQLKIALFYYDNLANNFIAKKQSKYMQKILNSLKNSYEHSKEILDSFRKTHDSKLISNCISALRSHVNSAQTSRIQEGNSTMKIKKQFLRKFFVEWQRAYQRKIDKIHQKIWQNARSNPYKNKNVDISKNNNISCASLLFPNEKSKEINQNSTFENLITKTNKTTFILQNEEQPQGSIFRTLDNFTRFGNITTIQEQCPEHSVNKEICGCNNIFTKWSQSVSFSKYNPELKNSIIKRECTVCSKPSVPMRICKSFINASMRGQNLEETILDNKYQNSFNI